MPPKSLKQASQIIQLQKVITSYTKSNPSHQISNTKLSNKNPLFIKTQFINEPMNSLKLQYRRMKERLKYEEESFSEGTKKIKKIIEGYFLKMRNILHDQQAQILERFSQICFNFGENINEYRKCMEERSAVLEQMDRKRQHISKDFEVQERNNISALSILNLPCFQIHLQIFDTFKALTQKFCPQFLVEGNDFSKPSQNHNTLNSNIPQQNQRLPLQDIQNNTNSDTTIKKVFNPQIDSQYSALCQFSCDQIMDWDSKASHDQRKHQIVSEIILQEPSSCEDSLMLN